jgi:hypothetical protein
MNGGRREGERDEDKDWMKCELIPEAPVNQGMQQVTNSAFHGNNEEK